MPFLNYITNMNDQIIDRLIFKEILNSQVSIESILIILALSTVIGMLIAKIYQKTFRGTSYSASFIFSLVLINIITAIVMLIIGSNLARAFGFIGALSIIRFRTAIKDTRDISFIFLSLIIGAAIGTENYHIAIISTIFITILIIVLDKINFGSHVSNSFFLTLDVDKNNHSKKDLKVSLDKYTSNHSLNSVNSVYGDDALLRYVYKININKKDTTSIISELQSLVGIKNISIVAADNYLNY